MCHLYLKTLNYNPMGHLEICLPVEKRTIISHCCFSLCFFYWFHQPILPTLALRRLDWKVNMTMFKGWSRSKEDDF